MGVEVEYVAGARDGSFGPWCGQQVSVNGEPYDFMNLMKMARTLASRDALGVYDDGKMRIVYHIGEYPYKRLTIDWLWEGEYLTVYSMYSNTYSYLSIFRYSDSWIDYLRSSFDNLKPLPPELCVLEVE